jgi:hypothetical protein
MKNINICVFEENNNLFIDLNKWQSISDIPIQIGDIFNFYFKNKKYFVKVIDIQNTDAKLKCI